MEQRQVSGLILRRLAAILDSAIGKAQTQSGDQDSGGYIRPSSNGMGSLILNPGAKQMFHARRFILSFRTPPPSVAQFITNQLASARLTRYRDIWVLSERYE
jgi:hypothetical protein